MAELLAVHSPELVSKLSAAAAAAAAPPALASQRSSPPAPLPTQACHQGGAAAIRPGSGSEQAPAGGGAVTHGTSLLACIAAAAATRMGTQGSEACSHAHPDRIKGSTSGVGGAPATNADSSTSVSSPAAGAHVHGPDRHALPARGLSEAPSMASRVPATAYGGTLAPDALVSAHTFQAASLAAGCSAQLAGAVVRGEVGSGFALVRPHGGCLPE